MHGVATKQQKYCESPLIKAALFNRRGYTNNMYIANIMLIQCDSKVCIARPSRNWFSASAQFKGDSVKTIATTLYPPLQHGSYVITRMKASLHMFYD